MPTGREGLPWARRIHRLPALLIWWPKDRVCVTRMMIGELLISQQHEKRNNYIIMSQLTMDTGPKKWQKKIANTSSFDLECLMFYSEINIFWKEDENNRTFLNLMMIQTPRSCGKQFVVNVKVFFYWNNTSSLNVLPVSFPRHLTVSVEQATS